MPFDNHMRIPLETDQEIAAAESAISLNQQAYEDGRLRSGMPPVIDDNGFLDLSDCRLDAVQQLIANLRVMGDMIRPTEDKYSKDDFHTIRRRILAKLDA